MKPEVNLLYLGQELGHYQIMDLLAGIRPNNVLSRNRWEMQTIFNDLNNQNHDIPLIIFDSLGFQYFLATTKTVQVPAPANSQQGSIHLVDRNLELIIQRHSIGVIRRFNDGKVTISDLVDQDAIQALEGNLARAFWNYELSKVEATITDDAEKWQEDLTDLNYRQLLALAGLVVATDRQPLDADYSLEDIADSDEQLELPTHLLHHISKIGRIGRAKFLVDVANALANLAPTVNQDEEETEILTSAFAEEPDEDNIPI